MRNILDWDMSSVHSDSTCAESGESAHDCRNCQTVLDLVEKLEKLCLDSLLLEQSQSSREAQCSVREELSISLDSLSDSSLSGVEKLFETDSGDVEEFSGFSDVRVEDGGCVKQTIRGSGSELLNEISRGLADIREVIARNKQESLERVREAVTGGREELGADLDDVGVVNLKPCIDSPPFLRSRGRVQELPYIPSKPWEYRRRIV